MRQLIHTFLETFFELPCSCAAAEERRKTSPLKEPSPSMRRGRKPKVRAVHARPVCSVSALCADAGPWGLVLPRQSDCSAQHARVG